MKFSKRFLEQLQVVSPQALAAICGLNYKTEANGNVDAFTYAKEEKTPSLKISVKNGITVWKDFSGSGDRTGGNAIQLYEAVFGLRFVDAVNGMAQALGIPVEYDEDGQKPSNQPDLSKLKSAVSWACNVYASNLDMVMPYLESRGISRDVAEKWKLGFAKDDWQLLASMLDPAQQKVAIEVGLLKESTKQKGKIFDFFRNRLIFPITQGGIPIAIGGRNMGGDGQAKYINSSASSIFNKSKVLYGFDNACKIGNHWSLIVEGYMDVIATDTVHIPAVGTCGTSLTEEHLKKFFSRFDEAVFCFDGDAAGIAAKRKAVEMILPYIKEGKSASFITLPDGKDPADLVLEGKLTPFENRQSLSQALTEEMEIMTEAEQMRHLKTLSERFSKLDDSLQRLLLINRISQKLNMDQNMIKTYFGT